MLKDKWIILSRKGKNFENLFIGLLAARITDTTIKREDPAELIASHWLQAGGNRYFLKGEHQEHKKSVVKIINT